MLVQTCVESICTADSAHVYVRILSLLAAGVAMRYSLLLLYARMHMLMPQELNCVSSSALHELLWCLSNEVRIAMSRMLVPTPGKQCPVQE